MMYDFSGLAKVDKELIDKAVKNYEIVLDKTFDAYVKANRKYVRDNKHKRAWPYFWRTKTDREILSGLSTSFLSSPFRELNKKGYLSDQHRKLLDDDFKEGAHKKEVKNLVSNSDSAYLTPEQCQFVNKWSKYYE